VGEGVLAAIGAHDGDARGEGTNDSRQPTGCDVMLAESVMGARVSSIDERETVVGVQSRRWRSVARCPVALCGHHVPFG